jgi:pyruvate-formate lyase-activating enzyme
MKHFIIIDCGGIAPGSMYFTSFSYSLLSMGSYLQENTGWNVRVLIPRMDFGFPVDMEGSEYIEEQIIASVQEQRGLEEKIVFGFSITSNEDIVYALPLAKKIKYAFDAPVLFGGFGPTIAHRIICEDYSQIVDAVIVGPGEIPCVEFLKSRERDGGIPAFPGIAFMDQGTIVYTPPQQCKTRPLPRELHMDIMSNTDYYRSVIYNSTYGCPFSCTFCTERYMNPVYWSKPLEIVEKELKTLCRYLRKPAYILFSGALFDFRHHRARRIADICEDLGVVFNCESHIETTPLEELPYIGKNCRAICYGLEHGSTRMLTQMSKTKHPSQFLRRFKELFRATTDSNITAFISVMINFPGTRHSDIEESIRFFDELHEDYYKRFQPGQGPGYMINFPWFRYPWNDFLTPDQRTEYDSTSATWKSWFEPSYRGFPVRDTLMRIIKDPSDEVTAEDTRNIIQDIQTKAGMHTIEFMKALEKRFPILNHRLWLGGDLITPCIDEDNPHIVSMKKLVELWE